MKTAFLLVLSLFMGFQVMAADVFTLSAGQTNVIAVPVVDQLRQSYVTPRTNSTIYPVGSFATIRGEVYISMSGGTSSNRESIRNGDIARTIVDGTVTWRRCLSRRYGLTIWCTSGSGTILVDLGPGPIRDDYPNGGTMPISSDILPAFSVGSALFGTVTLVAGPSGAVVSVMDW